MNSTAESLHRLVKEAIDSGAVATIAEGEEMFKRFRIGVEIGSDSAFDESCQAALLTAVALGRRVFLGGVYARCPSNVPLRVPLPLGSTLDEAVQRLGGYITNTDDGEPLVTIGDEPKARSRRFNVRTVFRGWRGGIMPAHFEMPPAEPHTLPLSPMLAAALAIDEAFSYVRGGSPQSGKRAVGLSLWEPESVNWAVSSADEPVLRYLPSHLWLIGLGHLGQAFLWALGLLPYRDAVKPSLVLQDIDTITPASESTSILTDTQMIGKKKTRVMAAWAESRGFEAAVIERRFAADFSRQSDEPAIALCGVDNALARRALDAVGFDLVVEAGLGRGYRDFRTMRLHTLPGPRPAAELWNTTDAIEDLTDRPAYEQLRMENALDRCGLTLLAGKAVGAPFIGAVASCLALAEILRVLHGGCLYQVIDLDLRAPEYRTIVRHPFDWSRLNPGFVDISSTPWFAGGC